MDKCLFHNNNTIASEHRPPAPKFIFEPLIFRDYFGITCLSENHKKTEEHGIMGSPTLSWTKWQEWATYRPSLDWNTASNPTLQKLLYSNYIFLLNEFCNNWTKGMKYSKLAFLFCLSAFKARTPHQLPRDTWDRGSANPEKHSPWYLAVVRWCRSCLRGDEDLMHGNHAVDMSKKKRDILQSFLIIWWLSTNESVKKYHSLNELQSINIYKPFSNVWCTRYPKI